jgi:hypothetical protein
MIGPAPYCFTCPGAAGTAFLDYVRDLTLKNDPFFQKNMASPGRKYLKIENVTADGDKTLFEIKQRLADYYRLGNYVAPPHLRDFISYITYGGAIHPHRDADLPGRRHVRINVLTNQPEGCIPVIDGIPIAVAVGDAWLNLASKCLHATTTVRGRGHRSALSFGYQIDQNRGDELYEIHRKWLSTQQIAGVFTPPDICRWKS